MPGIRLHEFPGSLPFGIFARRGDVPAAGESLHETGIPHRCDFHGCGMNSNHVHVRFTSVKSYVHLMTRYPAREKTSSTYFPHASSSGIRISCMARFQSARSDPSSVLKERVPCSTRPAFVPPGPRTRIREQR